MSEESNFAPPWSDKEYLITQEKPYLLYDEDEQKYKIAMIENVFVYEPGGEILKNCFSQEIVTNEDPTEKEIFEFKLKGNTRLGYRTDPKDN